MNVWNSQFVTISVSKEHLAYHPGLIVTTREDRTRMAEVITWWDLSRGYLNNPPICVTTVTNAL